MAKTNVVLDRARLVLLNSRQQLQTEIDAVDRALTALQGIGGRATNGRVKGRRRSGGASPKLLAALKRARAARQRKIAERKAAAR